MPPLLCPSVYHIIIFFGYFQQSICQDNVSPTKIYKPIIVNNEWIEYKKIVLNHAYEEFSLHVLLTYNLIMIK